MAILHSCCCWKSVRSGSFACAIYTLTFYIIVVTASAFHVNLALGTPWLFIFSLFALIFSGFCVISSILLLVGLCVDNHFLLLPWVISVSMTTLLDIFLSFYLIADVTIDPVLGALFVIDIVISGLNVYCILCVVSQFQDYLAGRENEVGRVNDEDTYNELAEGIVRINGPLPSISTTETLSLRCTISPSFFQPIYNSPHLDVEENINKYSEYREKSKSALIIDDKSVKLNSTVFNT
ncbi:uncharacterized protein LOC111639530 isoform X1 [Centruroides sculpturatus]|uniref:uncharacterized protein LOC111639530 isoform X1 n=1 Tax=Centruroides sculpturatus TaxID=218467 RepID=UPI000C6E3418|nr:uncharacterized protein LOC111639530 isoform X1 [Centruroides sculpturatus]